MKHSLNLAALAALLIVAANTPYAAAQTPPADLVLTNARVFTSNARRPWANAMAVSQGRFVYVGTNRGAKKHIGANTRVIDAGGQLVTPGFIDNHSHALWIGALGEVMAQVYDAASMDALTSSVRAFGAAHPGLPFVAAIGWKYDYVPGTPTAALADTIESQRPLILWSFDGHSGWMNTKGIEALQRNPAAFRSLKPIIDPATGQPTGLCHYFFNFNFLDYFTLQEFGPEGVQLMRQGLAGILQYMLSIGVTGLDDVLIFEQFVPLLVQFRQEGIFDDFRARASLYIGQHHAADFAGIERLLQDWKTTGTQHANEHLILGESVKLGMDGVFNSQTAFLLDPYSNSPTGTHGDEFWTQQDFDRLVELVDGMGIQACTHAIGDAAIQRVLNSYERAQTMHNSWLASHRIDHCELPIDTDQERMGRLHVLAAMQPAHLFGDENVLESLGPARVQRLMPWRSMMRRGIDMSFGSDWCAGPANPVYGLILATTRMNYTGSNEWGPREAIALQDAIRNWTIGSARAIKRADTLGSIEVGKLADFVVWRTDIYKWLLQASGQELYDLFEFAFPGGTWALRQSSGNSARLAWESPLDVLVDTTFVSGKAVYAAPDNTHGIGRQPGR